MKKNIKPVLIGLFAGIISGVIYITLCILLHQWQLLIVFLLPFTYINIPIQICNGSWDCLGLGLMINFILIFITFIIISEIICLKIFKKSKK